MGTSEQTISKKQVRDLLDLMGDDEQLRRQMAEVLGMELLGWKNLRTIHVKDVGRLRR